MAGVHNPLATVIAKLQGVQLGKKVKFSGIPAIIKTKDSQMKIGNQCTINSAFLSNLAGLYQRSVLVARDGAVLKIGNNTGMSGTTIYAKSGISIGNNCLIGANVKILDCDFHPTDPAERLNNPNDGKCAPVAIGNNVFIGANTIILKGITIGDNVTIGAGSVVTKSISSNTLAAGNPAVPIKKFSAMPNVHEQTA